MDADLRWMYWRSRLGRALAGTIVALVLAVMAAVWADTGLTGLGSASAVIALVALYAGLSPQRDWGNEIAARYIQDERDRRKAVIATRAD